MVCTDTIICCNDEVQDLIAAVVIPIERLCPLKDLKMHTGVRKLGFGVYMQTNLLVTDETL